MHEMGAKPADYDYVIFHQPNPKFPTRALRELGFTKEQWATGLLVGEIGNTYAGAALIGLAAVLDEAKPGNRILMVSYGSGAGSDAFDLLMTDKIVEKAKERTYNPRLHKATHRDRLCAVRADAEKIGDPLTRCVLN